MTVKVSLDIPPETHEQLKTIKVETGQSMSDFIRDAIDYAIDLHEKPLIEIPIDLTDSLVDWERVGLYQLLTFLATSIGGELVISGHAIDGPFPKNRPAFTIKRRTTNA